MAVDPYFASMYACVQRYMGPILDQEIERRVDGYILKRRRTAILYIIMQEVMGEFPEANPSNMCSILKNMKDLAKREIVHKAVEEYLRSWSRFKARIMSSRGGESKRGGE